MLFLLVSFLSGVLVTAGAWLLWRHFSLRANAPSAPQSAPLTEWDLRNMAYHEAGHAVCSFFLPERERLLVVTIDPSAEAFGMIRTELRPHHNETKTSFSSSLSTLLAGRLAEEIFLKNTTTSCIHDLAAAQSMATEMVTRFGMGQKLGLSVLTCAEGGISSEFHRRQIVEDIRQLLDEAKNNAEHILLEHKHTVVALAERLLEDKTLRADEISCFFEKMEGKHDEGR